nr:hypothetical protein [Endozoicomonas sp.]
MPILNDVPGDFLTFFQGDRSGENGIHNTTQGNGLRESMNLTILKCIGSSMDVLFFLPQYHSGQWPQRIHEFNHIEVYW